jgi:2-oxoglutarate dehydrogenase complex dehydrogenase (E1) component-like enzyme
MEKNSIILYFQKLLKDNKIVMYSTDSDLKAQIVERFTRTLKEKMWRYFTEKQTNKWTDILDDLINSYNNSYHTSIKIEPLNVNKRNENEICKNLYGYHKNEGDASYLNKFKFQQGDFVRLSKIKKTFEKGYTRNFTREIFVVDIIIPKDPISYKLLD